MSSPTLISCHFLPEATNLSCSGLGYRLGQPPAIYHAELLSFLYSTANICKHCRGRFNHPITCSSIIVNLISWAATACSDVHLYPRKSSPRRWTARCRQLRACRIPFFLRRELLFSLFQPRLDGVLRPQTYLLSSNLPQELRCKYLPPGYVGLYFRRFVKLTDTYPKHPCCVDSAPYKNYYPGIYDICRL